MSYDLQFSVLHKGVYIPLTDDLSPTYNLSRMFREAGFPIHSKVSIPFSKAVPMIEDTLHELTVHGEDYRKYEAENGWGTLQDAVSTMVSLKEFAEYIAGRYPKELHEDIYLVDGV